MDYSSMAKIDLCAAYMHVGITGCGTMNNDQMRVALTKLGAEASLNARSAPTLNTGCADEPDFGGGSKIAIMVASDAVGGRPAMNTPEIDGFEAIVGLTPAPLKAVTNGLRAVILAIDPDACVAIRLGDRAATFGLGSKKMSEGYAHIIPHANWVNLGFYRGTALDDPEGLLEGNGANMRHVKMRSLEACDRPAIAALIRAAIGERKRALNKE